MTQPTPAKLRPRVAFARLAGLSAATAVGLALVGCWPTAVQAGYAGVQAMLVGIGISLVGGWAGVVPTIAYLSKPPREHPTGILLGLGVRFGVTMVLMLAVWLSDVLPEAPLLLWIGVAQLVILAIDVYGLTNLLKRAAKETS